MRGGVYDVRSVAHLGGTTRQTLCMSRRSTIKPRLRLTPPHDELAEQVRPLQSLHPRRRACLAWPRRLYVVRPSKGGRRPPCRDGVQEPNLWLLHEVGGSPP